MEKRKVLVIGAFTNGEEAAHVFIHKQGWVLADCELVFCGSNGNVVRQLAHGPAFAVVPVYNSIYGKVPEVEPALEEARRAGCELVERDRIDLPINHCLVAPAFARSGYEVRRVLSHPVAMAQCGKYLASIGVTQARCYPSDSTGAAAESVARLRAEDDEHNLAAIAPRSAAERLGLKILAEHVEDAPGTFTTFLFLEHA